MIEQLSIRQERRWLLLALTVVLLAALPLLSYPFGRDQGDFAQMGDTILHGLTPYKDAWNPKPPLTFFLYAAVLSISRQMLAVDIFNIIIILATCWLLYVLGRRMFSPLIGLVAALGYGLAIVVYTFWYQNQSDEWMNLPLVAAACLFVRGMNIDASLNAGGDSGAEGQTLAIASSSLSAKSYTAWILASGVAVGVAFGFKYTGGGLGLVLLLLVWLWPKLPWRRKLGLSGALAAGFILALLPWLLFLAAHNTIGDWLESIATTNGYTRLSLLSPLYPSRILITSGRFLGLHPALSGFALLGGLAALWLIWQRRKSAPATAAPPLNLLIWGWILISYIEVLAQAKLYLYHWQPILPPLALAAGQGFAILFTSSNRLGPRLHWVVTAFCLVLLLSVSLAQQRIYPDFLAYVFGQQAPAVYNAQFVEGNDFSYSADVQAATYLDAHTSPGQRVFIWGFEPLVYWLAQREPVTRFTFNFPLVAWWYPREWQSEAISDLQRSPPVYIVVLHNDALPFVNNVPEDSAGQLKYFPTLADMLNRDYQFEAQVEDFSFYRLGQSAGQ